MKIDLGDISEEELLGLPPLSEEEFEALRVRHKQLSLESLQGGILTGFGGTSEFYQVFFYGRLKCDFYFPCGCQMKYEGSVWGPGLITGLTLGAGTFCTTPNHNEVFTHSVTAAAKGGGGVAIFFTNEQNSGQFLGGGLGAGVYLGGGTGKFTRID